jgi:hypothetical protein
MWNKLSSFTGQKGEKVTLPRLKIRVGSHGWNLNLHGAIERLRIDAGGLVNIAADDHRVDGGTAASKTFTKGVGGRWGNKKGRVTTKGVRMARVGLWAAIHGWWGAKRALLVRLAKRKVRSWWLLLRVKNGCGGGGGS